jgi:SrtB family sortase
LVCVKEIQVGNDTYQALPYIISLPAAVQSTGVARSSVRGLSRARSIAQEWNYHITMDLKLKRTAFSVVPQEPEEEEPSILKVMGKTGDNVNVALLLAAVIGFGILFAAVTVWKKKNKKSFLAILLGALWGISILLLTVVCVQYYMMRMHNDKIKEKVISDTSGQELASDGEEGAGESEKNLTLQGTLPVVDFEALRKINASCVGWIYACDGEISYPIVASEDTYYLSHAVDGETSRSGAIFVDSNSMQPFAVSRAVLYGHNMKDGSMFHPLLRYWQEQEYLSEHPYIYILMEDATYTYEITSVYVAEQEDITFTQDLSVSAQWLDLVTCASSDGDTRLVIEAKKL